MADEKAPKGTTAEATKKATGKTLKMVSIPTQEMNDHLTEAANAAGVSVNRYITNLIAAEFGISVPDAKRRTTSLRTIFESQNPITDGETQEDYDKRFVEFKSAQLRDANAKRAERTKSAISLMETLKAAAADGKLEELDVATLLAQLKA